MFNGDWHNFQKCNELTPEEADRIFFPPPGGKSKKADTYCEGCQVIDKCLSEQLVLGGPGFWAGTTERERQDMVNFMGLLPIELDNFLPPRALGKQRPRYRKVVTYVNFNPLDHIPDPTEDDLKAIEQ